MIAKFLIGAVERQNLRCRSPTGTMLRDINIKWGALHPASLLREPECEGALAVVYQRGSPRESKV